MTAVNVLLTRPAQQSKGLIELIRAQNWHAILFPVIEIKPMADKSRISAILNRLSSYDLAIFTSSNAAEYFCRQTTGTALPATVKIAAVGRASAIALATQGLKASIVPEGRFTSEGLLQHPALQTASGQKILIVRGQGGRPWLAEQLQLRGAEVEYIEVYRRVLPEHPALQTLAQFEQIAAKELAVIVCTSNEGIDNLMKLAAKEIQEKLMTTPLVVLSTRMEQHARQAGFGNGVFVADNATDKAIVETIQQQLAAGRLA